MFRQLTVPALACMIPVSAWAAEVGGAVEFRRDIRPILQEYCFDCHADGANKGSVAFDEFKSDEALLGDHDLWWKALKNLRAGLMPPNKKPQPTAAQKELIARWVKTAVFAADPQNPDPGRVTLRRLNRAEYRNTIRDLIGVDFDATNEFPPDDTGHGFDNIGDVLTLPPMLLEKYVVAATKIVSQAVPTTSRVVPESIVTGRQFRAGESQDAGRQRRGRNEGALSLSFYTPAAVTNKFTAAHAGKYQLAVDLMVNERYVDNVFDYNKCRVIFKVDGRELLRKEYSWEGGKPYHYDLDLDWKAGGHQLVFELQPLTPGEDQTRTLSVQITSVTVRGPMAKEHWVKPREYVRFFPKEVPGDAKGRRAYAAELLENFARKAFRRPTDEKTVNRLAALAESVYTQPGKTFEEGVAQGMVAVLASPRFLFRQEGIDPGSRQQEYAFVDDYSLASRLSYFLWSSMPDEELMRLAGERKLRQNLSAQVARMLADPRSEAFVKNFTGQWLHARDIETVQIDARSVLLREQTFDPDAERTRRRLQELTEKPDLSETEKAELESLRAGRHRGGRRQLRADLTPEVRRAMRQETEKCFDYVLREDRSLLELIDSDYTFLNEQLARHYGVTNVVGDEMRRVPLTPDSPRGGILTQGTVLAVTSNPTRTSPVKRGLFILDNVLGTPTPPPPPDIPPLEEATRAVTNSAPLLREALAIHRENALCSSCHNRMDPLGLALENFNAMGQWRDTEYEQPIDAAGKMITGEPFASVKELKQVLVKNHDKDFYRTITEKLLIYALGRGLDYNDVETVDQIVARIEKANGRPSALLAGIVESAPFQKTRQLDEPGRAKGDKPAQQRADARANQ